MLLIFIVLPSTFVQHLFLCEFSNNINGLLVWVFKLNLWSKKWAYNMGVFDSSMQFKVHNHPLLNAILMKHFSICMLVSSKSILLLLIKEMRLPPDFPIAIQCWHTKNYFILFSKTSSIWTWKVEGGQSKCGLYKANPVSKVRLVHVRFESNMIFNHPWNKGSMVTDACIHFKTN